MCSSDLAIVSATCRTIARRFLAVRSKRARPCCFVRAWLLLLSNIRFGLQPWLDFPYPHYPAFFVEAIEGFTRRLRKCAAMSKTAAQESLAKLVRPVNEQRGAVEYTLQGFARSVVFPWYERSWKPSTAMTTKDRIDRGYKLECVNGHRKDHT